MKDRNNSYRIGELSKLAGISRRTIDFYTRIGLLVPEERSEGNYRLYSSDSLQRLVYINEMKTKKFTLQEIRERLHVVSQLGSDPNGLLMRVHKLEEDLLSIEREVTSLKPQLTKVMQQARSSNEIQTSIQRTLAQGLSLAQAILLLLDPNLFL